MNTKKISAPALIFKIAVISVFFAAAFPSFAFASSDLWLNPKSGSYIIGRDFSVSVTVGTGGNPINAGEGKLVFDKSRLAVSSIDTSQSIFTIWVKYPSFSNSNGTISFIGGAPSPGFTGTGPIFTIHFKGVALGDGIVSFLDGARILLNDGLGTNVTGKTTGGVYTILPEPLSVSCSASPSSAIIGQAVNFKASASGGIGSYSYLWSGECAGSSATCAKSFSAIGAKTATVTVKSGTESVSSKCSAGIGFPGLNLSCSASKESVEIGEPATFTALASGGGGLYNYSWSGACTGNSEKCISFFNDSGLKTAAVTVTSGNKASSANCSLYVNVSCPVIEEGTSHTVCHNQKCIYVFGSGTDECRQNEECSAALPINSPINSTVETIKNLVNTPIGSVATKTIATFGLVAAAAFASPISLPELLMLPTRLLGLLLIAFGWKKRNPPWGVVYDSITKQPLDPAYVILKDLAGKDVSSAITDLDGRYGFLIEPGTYKMTANKTNYIFPSQKLAGKNNDELYDNLYFGAAVEIKDRNEIITRNIPLDPLKFDWNEFTKQKRSLTKFYSSWDSLVREISDFIYAIGFVVAVIAFFAAPYPYNTIILGLYLVLLLLRILGLKPKPFGSVVDKITGEPLAFAIIRVADPSSNTEISQKITDKYGRYFCLVPKGRYYVKVEKKNNDGSYSLVYTSPVIDAFKNGIIKNKFKV